MPTITTAPQLEDFVFDFKGNFMPHHIENRIRHQKMCALSRDSSPLSTELSLRHVEIPDIALTEEERDEAVPGRDEYLWVGLAFVDPEGQLVQDFTPYKAKEKPKPGPTGIDAEDNFDEEVKERRASLRAVRVGTPCSGKISRMFLYGLVDQACGLCKAFQVKKSSVMYFAEYRNKDTASKSRETTWSNLIKIALVNNQEGQDPDGPRTNASTIVQAASISRHNFCPIRVDASEILCNSLRQLISVLNISASSKEASSARLIDIAQQVKTKLEGAEPDVLSRLEGNVFALLDFIDSGMAMTPDLAVSVKNEAAQLWKIELDEKAIFSIGQSLRTNTTSIIVSFRLLRPFLVITSSLFESQDATDESLKQDLVQKGWALARQAVGEDLEPRYKIVSDPHRAFVQSLVKSMEWTVAHLQQNREIVKDGIGDDLKKTDDIQEILAYANSSIDVDMNDVAVVQLGRKLVGDLQALDLRWLGHLEHQIALGHQYLKVTEDE